MCPNLDCRDFEIMVWPRGTVSTNPLGDISKLLFAFSCALHDCNPWNFGTSVHSSRCPRPHLTTCNFDIQNYNIFYCLRNCCVDGLLVPQAISKQLSTINSCGINECPVIWSGDARLWVCKIRLQDRMRRDFLRSV